MVGMQQCLLKASLLNQYQPNFAGFKGSLNIFLCIQISDMVIYCIFFVPQ